MTSLDLSKSKTDKPMQPVIEYPPILVQPIGHFKVDGANNSHCWNISSVWMLCFT